MATYEDDSGYEDDSFVISKSLKNTTIYIYNHIYVYYIYIYIYIYYVYM